MNKNAPNDPKEKQMRKSLIALACLSACCTMATAGTVEIYGAVDTYIAVNNNDNGNTSVRLSSGGASASYFGFKGMEEISPETQVMYRLEQAYLSETGTTAAGADGKMFSREAWVGVHNNNWGMLSLGRQYTPHFLTFAITDPTDLSLGSSHSPYFFPSTTGVNGDAGLENVNLVRHENSIMYVSPTMGGVTVFAYAALGEEKADKGSNDGNIYNIAANYANGPLFVMASVLRQSISGNQPTNLGFMLDGTASAPGANQTEGHDVYYNIGATYDFGVTKVSALYMKRDGDGSVSRPDFWIAQLGAATPVWGGRWSVSVATLQNESQKDADAWSFGTRFDYPFSKRTKVYAGVSGVFNDDGCRYSVEAGPDSSVHFASGYGEDQVQAFVGLNHRF